MVDAIVAAVALGALSTLGDFVWEVLRLRHRMYYGIAHGAVICLAIGAFIGWRAGRGRAGLLAGPIVGVVAAAMFYVLAPWLRYSAMFPAWMFFWICFAALQARLMGTPLSAALARGIIAALLSGAAFYAISGIWTRPPSGGPNYAWNFVAWSFAFLPGFAALFFGSPRSAHRSATTVANQRADA